jgi:hypothetical protein
MRKLALLFVALLGALPLMATTCDTATSSLSRSCEVRLEAPSPAEGLPGAEVTVGASPLTTLQDSRLFVGGLEATLLSLDREGCDACDACILEADCNPCEDCDSCDALCDAECTESLRFEVPALGPGAVKISLYNLFGSSDGRDFTVLEETVPEDTGDEPSEDSGMAPE